MGIREININNSICPIDGDRDSLFICCASYEARSTAIVERFRDKYKTEHAIVFLSNEYKDKGQTPSNYKFIVDTLQNIIGETPETIDFNIDKPIPSMRKFEDRFNACEKIGKLKSVSIDITTFPRQELFVLLRVIDSIATISKIRLFYTEPNKYDSEDRNGWLTSGVKSVRTIPGFGGIQQPQKKKLLVMFLGHEEERAAITWKRHQPNMTIPIIPCPNYKDDFDGIVENRHHAMLSRMGNSKYQVKIPARGIEESRDIVLAIWEKYYGDYFFIVAPLGTKLQSLGVYMAAKIKRDIQITYAMPSLYNYNSFSQGVDKIWEIQWNY